MLIKSDPDGIQSFLGDASNLAGGHASRVVLPESAEEVAEVLARCSRDRTPVTVSGAGTGVVGGRVPFGGVVLSTDRLDQIKEVAREDSGGGRATAGAGVRLADLERAARVEGLLYPPDPTEWSCSLGGTVATNASGARTFKYGPTRAYVRRLQVALATGDLVELRRGEVRAGDDGRISLPLAGGRKVEARLPSYAMPRTRKHAAGYFVEQRVDAVDLFVGSEGTLGVVTEVEVALLPRPAGVLGGIVFFAAESDLLAFVREARERSLRTRGSPGAGGAARGLDARALEYFDVESLKFLRERYPLVPLRAEGAVFFEQEVAPETEDVLMGEWLALVEGHRALADDSWFGTSGHDRAEMRAFRHALPVMVNEWLARRGQRKVSTDAAVPDAAFPALLNFYRERLRASRLAHVIFGHVGDNHVHVNILPRDAVEAAAARELYGHFIARAVELGGTISAEHGVGKLKRDHLRALYGEGALREMAALKRAFDPVGVLGRGNIFAEEYLWQNAVDGRR
ncbi:MAG TPA: FAD-binding oxidoreductase [Pyrinomonadaceae bacterium]|nr:FAD-binding oxidoreductase [Pyrinomonadaceae bacterium]